MIFDQWKIQDRRKHTADAEESEFDKIDRNTFLQNAD